MAIGNCVCIDVARIVCVLYTLVRYGACLHIFSMLWWVGWCLGVMEGCN